MKSLFIYHIYHIYPVKPSMSLGTKTLDFIIEIIIEAQNEYFMNPVTTRPKGRGFHLVFLNSPFLSGLKTGASGL